MLRRFKIRTGSRVLICHGNTPDFFADLLAVWHLGACAVCLGAGALSSEIENVVKFVSPSLILVDDNFSGGHGLRVPTLCSSIESPPEPLPGIRNLVIGSKPDRPALMLFTSGTTSTPKGVVHSFRSLLSRLALNRKQIGDCTLSNTLCALPTNFGHGLIGNSLTPLFAGKNLFLARLSGIKGAAGLPELIDSYQITFMSSVPTLWNLVPRVAKPPTKGSLRQVSVGLAPLSAKLWKGIIDWCQTKNVVNMYGITELAN